MAGNRQFWELTVGEFGTIEFVGTKDEAQRFAKHHEGWDGVDVSLFPIRDATEAELNGVQVDL